MNRAAASAAALALAVAVPGAQSDTRASVADRVMRLSRGAPWKQTGTVPLAFAAHHPQGMVKIGDTFFVSSVEITVRTRRFSQPAAGYDRDAGEGVGHLFKMDSTGKLVADLRLGEDTVYHPGGIDFDGTHIWVPVAEYRPDSRAIVYRVDPETMRSTEVFRVADHIGAIVHDTDSKALHGVSWGSRRFYRWTLGADGRVTNLQTPLERLRTLNAAHYVDYQDCKYVGALRMLCTGIAELHQAPGAPPLRLGGIELVDLRDGRPLHQVPLSLWTAGGLNMAQNPAWIESSGSDRLRAYFMPEDGRSTLYRYEVVVD